MSGIILYGPPASGKDTIAAALTELKPVYQLFPRLKCGPGRTAGYRMVDADQLAAYRAAGEIVYENRRYEAVYAVDRSYLRAMAHDGVVPVVLLGQVEAVETVLTGISDLGWLVVELHCPRHVAQRRSESRATGDTAERMAAFDATARLSDPGLQIDTSVMSPAVAASTIAAAATGTQPTPAGQPR